MCGMTITIKDHSTITLLTERFEELRKNLGAGSQVATPSELATRILKNKLEKTKARTEHARVHGKGANSGITWLQFRRENFGGIYMRDKGRCIYCEQRVTREQATLDHKMPVTRGGQNTETNCSISCMWCNKDKGILSHEEYFYKQLVNAAKGISPEKPH